MDEQLSSFTNLSYVSNEHSRRSCIAKRVQIIKDTAVGCRPVTDDWCFSALTVIFHVVSEGDVVDG